MPTLLMGHGQVMTNERVIVPDEWSISFLIDQARTLPFSNGVGVVMNIASLQNEGFTLAEYHEGGEEIANHVLHVLTSNQRAWYAQVDPEDGSCYYAGEGFDDGLRLCEDPGPTGQCAQNEGGVHTCGGLLSFDWPDKNLVWVSCRQDADPKVYSKGQLTFGSEANDPENVQKSDFVAFAESVQKRLLTDQAGFADYFDTLSDEEVAQVMYKLPVRRWSFQRQAREWLANGTTDEQFYAFVEGQDEVDQGLYIKGDDSFRLKADDLKAAYERGKFVRQARDYLDKRGATNFKLYVNGLDSASQTILAGYPDLLDASKVEADPTSEESQSARFGMTVAEIDWSMVQAVNEKAIKDTPDKGRVDFWQLPSGEVLIGRDQQPEVYRKLIEAVRDGEANPTGKLPNGTITVTKGGITSKGKLDVRGATDQGSMESWLASFSDKKVVFVP